MEKKLIVVRPNTVSAKDKEKLTKSGYVVIEHPIPSEVKVLLPGAEIDPNIMLMSALNGIDKGDGYGRKAFFDELYKRLKEIENKKP